MGSKLTIGKRFIITSGTLLLLSTMLSLVAIWGFNKVGRNLQRIESDTVPSIMVSASLRGDVNGLRADYLRRILSTEASAVEKSDQFIATDEDHLAQDLKTYEGMIDLEEDRQNFSKLGPELTVFHEIYRDKVVPLLRTSNAAEAYKVYLNEAFPHLAAVRDELSVIVDWNKKDSNATSTEATAAANSAWWMTIVVAVLALVLGICLSWYMVAALNKELNRAVTELAEGADQIAGAASQVSASSQSLAQGSSEQAASIEETSASSEEINSMARKNTDNSRSMAALVTESQEMFARTNRQLEEMVVSMDEINQSSDKISKIIKVIDEIAFQTNILALNAAVEAARAGEAGMGFAVVADEVRNLAQRSAQAAKDTAALIEESISKSNGGKVKVDQVATAIRAITEDSRKIKTLVDEVTLGSEEQSRGLDQIAKAISQMEQVTQTTAANAEESAAAAEELNAQSETLKDVVAQLNAMVRGSEQVDKRPSTARQKKNQPRRAFAETGGGFASHLSAPRSSRASHNAAVEQAHFGSAEENGFPLEAAFKEF